MFEEEEENEVIERSIIVVHVDPNLPREEQLTLTRKGIAKARKFLADPANGLTEAVELHVDMTPGHENDDLEFD